MRHARWQKEEQQGGEEDDVARCGMTWQHFVGGSDLKMSILFCKDRAGDGTDRSDAGTKRMKWHRFWWMKMKGGELQTGARSKGAGALSMRDADVRCVWW